MKYSEFAEVYEKLSKVSGRFEKVAILSNFLKELKKNGKSDWGYLLFGRVFPAYDSREFGISTQLVIKAIAVSYGVRSEEVSKRFNKVGDLGGIAEEFAEKKRQSQLFSKKLSVQKVFENLRKVAEVEGKGAVDKKMALVSELLGQASGKEAKYIIRTLLSDLKVGVAEGVLRDGVAEAFSVEAVKVGMALDISNDFAVVFEAAAKGEKSLEKIGLNPSKPMNVMLAVKAETISEAFEICGRPAALEYKYDGFRVVITKKGKEIKLFTRRLEDVTKQFPDVVSVVSKNVKGESFILDSEVVGYDVNTGRYTPFQAISQRIKRKYEIEKLIDKLPVEVNIFDVLFYDGEDLMNKPFSERRKLIEKIVHTEKWKIRTSELLISDNDDKAQKFYERALEVGEEGVMVKKLDAPYQQGRKVGYMVKVKPIVEDFDLVIVGAEHGTGKRGGWLTSYIVACRSGDEFLEVGKVSSGLKEIEGDEGTTYDEMTKLLKPLITGTKGNVVSVKPKIVVSVNYQEIQKSPSYSAGYALRFPRITAYRPDRNTSDITTLQEIEKEVLRTKRK